jgi:hypothetical protein
MPAAALDSQRPTCRLALGAADLEVARRLLRKKEQIVQQVCRGQLDLLTAAARFREVTRTAERGGWSELCRPGPQDAESVCRTVIAWAGLALADRPERAAAVTARLEAELETNLARLGRVEFPDPNEANTA